MHHKLAFGWSVCCVITLVVALVHLKIADNTSTSQQIEMLEDRYEQILTIELIIGVLYFVAYSMAGGTI